MSNHWTAFCWKDYQNDTEHLSLAEHGAYFLLLSYYYRTAGPITANADRLLKVCRAFGDPERATLLRVLDEFFVLEGEHYRHARCDKEIAKGVQLSEKRSEAGKLGAKHTNNLRGKPAANTTATPATNERQMPTQSQSQSQSQKNNPPTPLPIKFSLEDFRGDDAFQRYVAIWNRHRAKAERGHDAQNAYLEAVEERVGTGKCTRKEAAEFIDRRADLYLTTKLSFRTTSTQFLKRRVYEQHEDAWQEDTRGSPSAVRPPPPSPADEARKQRGEPTKRAESHV